MIKQIFAIILIVIFTTSCVNQTNSSDHELSLPEQKHENIDPSETKTIQLYGTYECIKLEEDNPALFFLDDKNYIYTFCYDGFLRIYSKENGKVVFTKDYSSLGNLMRMEKYSLKEGFDYRLCFGDRIIYLNFNDFYKIEEFFIPNRVCYDIDYSFVENGYYDFNEKKLVYTLKNGICLFDGHSPKIIAENSMFLTVAEFVKKTSFEGDCDISSPIYLSDPRFICDNTKIVIGVFSQWDEACVGCVIYNIEQDSFENYIYCAMPQYPVYPIEDRYINIPGEYIFDVKTGNSKGIEYDCSGYISHNYKIFIIYNFKTAGYPGLYEQFEAYIFDNDSGEKNMFFSIEENTLLSIVGITENYFIVELQSYNDNEIYALNYKID